MGQKPLEGRCLPVLLLLYSLCDTHLKSSDVRLDCFPWYGFPASVSADRRIGQFCHRHLLSHLRRFSKFSRNETPDGCLLTFASGKFRTRIRSITDRHSLLPSSLARTSVGSPCGLLSSSRGNVRDYHVPRKYLTDRLGSAHTPVELHLRWRMLEPPYLSTYLLVQACQHLWLVYFFNDAAAVHLC